MADIRITDGRLEVALTRRERIAGLLGDVDVPVTAIRHVEVVDDAFDAVRGLRAPGLALPGVTRVGTWRGGGRRSYVVARAGRRALVVDLEGQWYDRLVLSTTDAASLRDRLRSAVG
ncbi:MULTISPECIES: hypothetical protein [unclassified Agromyces]|uniref:hypothetical protein n=1 Tax=unclassified Agromyces TaxID=2639701 RepID=UPI003014E01D